MDDERWAWGQKLKTVKLWNSRQVFPLWFFLCESLMLFLNSQCNTITRVPLHKHALFSRVKSSEVFMCAGIFFSIHPSSLYRAPFFLCCTNCAPGIKAFYCSDTWKAQRICWSWTSEWPQLCNTKGPHAAPATSSPGEPLPAAEQIIRPTHPSLSLFLCSSGNHTFSNTPKYCLKAFFVNFFLRYIFFKIHLRHISSRFAF